MKIKILCITISKSNECTHRILSIDYKFKFNIYSYISKLSLQWILCCALIEFYELIVNLNLIFIIEYLDMVKIVRGAWLYISMIELD